MKSGPRWLALSVTALVGLAIAACSGPNAPTGPASENVGNGWVHIQCPANGVRTSDTLVAVIGEAFFSRDYACLPCEPPTPGVEMSLVIESAGGMAVPVTSVLERTYPFILHHWWALVPLFPDANRIRVTAADSAGNIGRASIVITRDATAPPGANRLDARITGPTTDSVFTTTAKYLTLRVQVTGDMTEGSAYCWNDAFVPGNPDGHTWLSLAGSEWTGAVGLLPGSNFLRVVANNRCGSGRDSLRVVLTPTSP